MSHLSRFLSRLLLGCLCLLTSVAVAEDPSLQLYLDFESSEPGRIWMLRDRSQNGFLVQLGNFGGKISLVPTKSSLALSVPNANTGQVLTNGSPIYARGQGLTVSIWIRLEGDGFVEPILVGNHENANPPLLRMWIARAKDSIRMPLTWEAYQQDGVNWAFRCNTQVAPTSEWFHYAAVYDPDAKLAFMYLDGKEVARAKSLGDIISDWDEPGVQMLFYPKDGTPLFVDELRLYARALSPNEIGEVMWKHSPLSVSAREKLAASWGVLKRR